MQTNDGKWRGEAAWPPADAKGYTSKLRAGTYSDDGQGPATGGDAEGVWTISPPLTAAAHLAGSGKAVVDVATTRPNANLVVDVYDLDQNGNGPLITRQGFLARSSRRARRWTCGRPTGRSPRATASRCRVTDANDDWWIHAPLLDDVKVVGGSVTLPFLAKQRTQTIQGDPGTQLAGYLGETITVPPETLRDSVSPSFALPPAQTP